MKPSTSEGFKQAEIPNRDPGTGTLSLDGRYVLMTAAYNEEENIGKTIESLLSQTRLPERWAIVSDGSSDSTDQIVQSFANRHDLIRFSRMERAPGRSFGSKVIALQHAQQLLDGISYDFIGNLDADITLDTSYFEILLRRFAASPGLGIAGGFVHDKVDGKFRSRRANRTYSVAHAAQLARRACYEEIGGYAVLEFGGEDWHAQTSARMYGWQAEAFADLNVYHHRRTGEADGLVRYKLRQGRMDYSLGSDPIFEVLKCLERIPEKPFLIGGLARLAGFSWACARRDRRPVSAAFMSFLRDEQRAKMKSVFTRTNAGAADEFAIREKNRASGRQS